MTMQDRAYAVAIFIILGFCCIGAYVAISGFLNANPGGLAAALNNSTATPTVGVTIVIPTETAAPPTITPPPPTRTPKGFQPTDTPAITRPPTLDFIPTVATPEFTPTPEVTATPAASGCGAEFCPRPGPADAGAPGGNPCPANLIWGFVTDHTGQGVAGVKVHFQDVNGNAGEKDTKGPPDRPGIYDLPVGNGVWTVQLTGKKDQTRSTPFQVVVGQAWGGSGNCPTRVDFVQQ